MRHILFGLVGLFLIANVDATQAETHRFRWTGELIFDQNAAVPGGTLGSLLAEISGRDDLNGRMPISGHVVYDDGIEATAMNGNVGGFRGAVLEMAMQLGPVPLVADMPRIALNAATSHIGVRAFDNGAFCSDTEHCDAIGVVGPSWGNMMLLHNSTGHFFIDESGTTTQFGDLFGAAVGRTDAPADFLPQIQTRGHGLVAVGGQYLALFPAQGREFFTTHDRLPSMDVFRDWTNVGRTEIIVFLELPGEPEAMRVEGVVHTIEIEP